MDTPHAARVVSVDVLRGIVMFTMVFVNDIAGVKVAPAWMKHFPADGDGMTFVDWVFPAFLFVMGMSVPLASARHRSTGLSPGKSLLHVLLRVLGLLLLGVLMVNMPANAGVMGWRKHLWETLIFLFSIIAFSSTSTSTDRSKRVWLVFRVVGFGALGALVCFYRGAVDESHPQGVWLRPQWWGILGLIGWAYLVCWFVHALLWWDRVALLMSAVVLMSLFYASQNSVFDGLWIGQQIDIGTMLGSHGAIAVVGAVVGSMLVQSAGESSHRRRIWSAVALGALMALTALLLRKPYGINKNAATPAWCLWSSAFTCWLWAVVYLLADVLKQRWWATLFMLAGSNALLLYLLHPLWHHASALFGAQWYDRLGTGSLSTGVYRSLALAASLTLLVGLAGKVGFRLRL